jgi:hypothetical protein
MNRTLRRPAKSAGGFRGAFAAWACTIAAVAAVGEDKPAADPKPERHDTRSIEGWTVRVDARLLEGPNQSLGDTALKLLAADLFAIARAVPTDRLAKLQEVPIWLDLTHGELRQMQYHPSADWLREHGYSEQLERGVHIPRAELFTDPRHRHTQPWATLHELAHAYHDRVLGFDDPKIVAVYERLRDAERYRSVLHVNGVRREHYARTNPMEFFAELSESYFGTNDFYPFVRGELQEDNPEAFALLEEIWGVSASQ